MLKQQLAQKLSGLRESIELSLTQHNDQLNQFSEELKNQAIRMHIKEEINKAYLNPFIQKYRYVLVCPKVLLWESQVDEFKKECIILTDDQEDFALMEFSGEDSTQALACFFCGQRFSENE